MQIVKLDKHNQRDMQEYLRFPFQLYKNNFLWVPPFADDARNEINPEKNPYFEHSYADFFLARSASGQILGRIAALENTRHNDFHQRNVAFFNHFEVVDDKEASDALFAAAFDWAQSRGLDTFFGPKGFNPLSGQGILVEGFDEDPAFAAVVNPAYYGDFIEAAGFRKIRDSLTGPISFEGQLPERVHEVAERVKQRRGLKVMNFSSKKQLMALVPEFTRLYKRLLVKTEILGSFAPTVEQVSDIAKQLFNFVDPSLIKIVRKGEELIGFILAYPNVNPAIRRCKGRILPFGWLDIMRELRRTRVVDLNGGGIVPEHQGMGGTAVITSELGKVLFSGRFDRGEIVQVGEENRKMQREAFSLGIKFTKKHRFYVRDL